MPNPLWSRLFASCGFPQFYASKAVYRRISRIESESDSPFLREGRRLGCLLFPPNCPPPYCTAIEPARRSCVFIFYRGPTNAPILSPESFSLATRSYKRWEGFLDQLKEPLDALLEIYEPSFFTRVGLRYIDGVERGPLNLGGCRWSQLLRPEILGELALSQFEDNVENAQRVIEVKLPDAKGSIALRHGLGKIINHTETCYMIDLNFFTDQKAEVRDARGILSGFNDRAGRAFRWCITPSALSRNGFRVNRRDFALIWKSDNALMHCHTMILG